MQIVVTGMHRSGTSMLTSVLEGAGLYLGSEKDLMLPQWDNPKGFFERNDVSHINDQILAFLGSTWDCVSVDKLAGPLPAALTDQIKGVITDLNRHPNWVMKDPRFCLVFEYWRPFLENPIVLFCVRDPIAVASSLKDRNRIPIPIGISLWETYVNRALRSTNLVPRLAIRYEDMLLDAKKRWQSIVAFLGERFANLDLREANALSQIDPQARHFQSDENRLNQWLNKRQHSLWAFMNGDSFCDAHWDEPLSEPTRHLLILNETRCHMDAHLKARDAHWESRLAELSAKENRLIAHKDQQLQATLKELKTVSEAKKQLAQENKRIKQDLKKLAADSEAELRQIQAASQNSLQRALDLQKCSVLLLRWLPIKNQLWSSWRFRLGLLLSPWDRASRHRKARIDRLYQQIADRFGDLQLFFHGEGHEKPIPDGVSDQMNKIFAELLNEFFMLETSLAWRLGCRLFFVPDRLLGKHNGTFDQFRRVLTSFDYELVPPIERVALPQERLSKPILFLRLVLACLAHPRRTLSFANAKSIRGFFDAFFRKQPEVTQDVTNTYLRLLKNETSYEIEEIIAKVDPTAELIFPNSSNPKVSIVIPVFNKYKITMNCLQSLASTIGDIPVEILLGDDCSDDETRNLQIQVPSLRVIRHENNLGFLHNCNETSKFARAPFILFLNNDTLFRPGWLQELLRLIESKGDIGAVGPKFLFPDGRLQEAGGIVWNDGSAWNYGKWRDAQDPEFNYVKDVDYVSGACLLVRRQLWQRLDGFDSSFSPGYYEDTDLCFRLRQSGYRVVYQPKSEVIHLEGASHGTDTTTGTKAYQEVNRKKFREKWKAELSNQYPSGTHVFHARDRSRGKRTLLLIDHYVPHYDRDAGSQHTFHYLQWFQALGLHVLFMGDNFNPHEPYTSELQQQGIQVLYGSKLASTWSRWMKEHESYLDIICVHRPHIAEKYIPVLTKLQGPRLIYFGHDLHFLRTQRQANIMNNGTGHKEAKAWKKREQNIIAQVEASFFPSQAEVEHATQEFNNASIFQIPLFLFDPHECQGPSWSASGRSGLLFVGGFAHPPNADAMHWFFSEIWPLLIQKHGSVPFRLVGSKIGKSLKATIPADVQIFENVSQEKLADLYAETRIAVVPLRYGAGIKGKLVEALKHGVPVVSTSIGAEGFENAEQYMELADSPAGFGTKISDLMNRDDLCATRVESGYQALREIFSKEKAWKVMEPYISEQPDHHEIRARDTF